MSDNGEFDASASNSPSNLGHTLSVVSIIHRVEMCITMENLHLSLKAVD